MIGAFLWWHHTCEQPRGGVLRALSPVALERRRTDDGRRGIVAAVRYASAIGLGQLGPRRLPPRRPSPPHGACVRVSAPRCGGTGTSRGLATDPEGISASPGKRTRKIEKQETQFAGPSKSGSKTVVESVSHVDGLKGSRRY